MLARRERIALLFDFYGALLTERQQFCVIKQFIDDWSLVEIAEQLEISRQAVHDCIQRTIILLEEYEAKLSLASVYTNNQRLLKMACERLDEALSGDAESLTGLLVARDLLNNILTEKFIVKTGWSEEKD